MFNRASAAGQPVLVYELHPFTELNCRAFHALNAFPPWNVGWKIFLSLSHRLDHQMLRETVIQSIPHH